MRAIYIFDLKTLHSVNKTDMKKIIQYILLGTRERKDLPNLCRPCGAKLTQDYATILVKTSLYQNGAQY
jgi:hypothetical protein